MLNEKQLKAIELYITGMSVTDLSEEIGIGRRTFYDWIKKDEFTKAIDEAIENQVKIMKQQMRGKASEYIKSLEQIARKGKNDNARVNALSKLLTISGLDPGSKQEITINSEGEKDNKNKLLEMLQEDYKKDKQGQRENAH